MFFTKDILEIVSICKKDPSFETITLLCEFYDCSESSIHLVLSRFLPEYKELFKNIKERRVVKRKIVGPPCPYCATENSISKSKCYWLCENCGRKWRKVAKEKLTVEEKLAEKLKIAEEKLKDIKMKRLGTTQRLRDSLQVRKSIGLPLGRPPFITSESVNKIVELREQNFSYKQISELVGDVCPATCYQIVRRVKAGLKLWVKGEGEGNERWKRFERAIV